jgi:hypothetical protein
MSLNLADLNQDPNLKEDFMGYKSQVGFVVGKETYNEKVTSDLKEALKDCDCITENEHSYYFTWDSVKWYEDNKHVKTIQQFVEDNLDNAGLVIVGEDADDNREIGSPYNFDLSLIREVYVPESKEIKRENFFANNAVKFITKI